MEPSSPGGDASEHRSILALAWPVIVENAFVFIVGLFDAAIMGHVGAASLAGMGAAATLLALGNSIPFALGTGGIVVVARAVGSGDAAARRAAESAVMRLHLFAGILLSLVYLLGARPFISWMGLEPAAMDEGVVYMRLMALNHVLFFFAPAARVILLAHGKTRRTVWMGITMHGLHLALLPVFVHGWGAIPPMRAAGVAVATLVSVLAGGLLGLEMLRREGLLTRGATAGASRAAAREIVGIGLPSGGEILLYLASQTAILRIVSILGTHAIAATIVLKRLFGLSVFLQQAFGQAAMIREGQSAEAGKPKTWQQARPALHIAIALAEATSLLFVLLPESAARLLAGDPAAVALVHALFPVAAILLVPQAVNIVAGGALRGAGRTRWMLGTQSVGLVLVLAASYALGISARLGLLGIFLGLAIDEIVRGVWNLHHLSRAAAPTSAKDLAEQPAPDIF